MKDHQYEIVIFLFMLLVVVLGGAQYSNTEKSHRIEDLTLENDSLKNELSVVNQMYWDQATINIMLINKVGDSEQEELKKDERYMQLVTKND